MASQWAQYTATQNVDLDCNSIVDVSGINFCDGSSYVGYGSSLDISSNERINISTAGFAGVSAVASSNTIIANGSTSVYTTRAPGTLDITSNTSPAMQINMNSSSSVTYMSSAEATLQIVATDTQPETIAPSLVNISTAACEDARVDRTVPDLAYRAGYVLKGSETINGATSLPNLQPGQSLTLMNRGTPDYATILNGVDLSVLGSPANCIQFYNLGILWGTNTGVIITDFNGVPQHSYTTDGPVYAIEFGDFPSLGVSVIFIGGAFTNASDFSTPLPVEVNYFFYATYDPFIPTFGTPTPYSQDSDSGAIGLNGAVYSMKRIFIPSSDADTNNTIQLVVGGAFTGLAGPTPPTYTGTPYLVGLTFGGFQWVKVPHPDGPVKTMTTYQDISGLTACMIGGDAGTITQLIDPTVSPAATLTAYSIGNWSVITVPNGTGGFDKTYVLSNVGPANNTFFGNTITLINYTPMNSRIYIGGDFTVNASIPSANGVYINTGVISGLTNLLPVVVSTSPLVPLQSPLLAATNMLSTGVRLLGGIGYLVEGETLYTTLPGAGGSPLHISGILSLNAGDATNPTLIESRMYLANLNPNPAGPYGYYSNQENYIMTVIGDFIRREDSGAVSTSTNVELKYRATATFRKLNSSYWLLISNVGATL